MKNIFTLYFILFSLVVCAQDKETIAIKIYLEDAETGKNIDDAKVMLEGFEIPAITGKYDKTGKCYYFTKIPVGYNTIMAYHKEYNEKGFQNVEGLPKELKLRLYDPFNVSYSFEKPILSIETCCDNGKRTSYLKTPKFLKRVEHSKKKISRKTFRYIYKEDPYHIAIISKHGREQLFNNDIIKQLMQNLSIEEAPEDVSWGKYQYYNLFLNSEGHLSFWPYSPFVYLLQKKDSTKFQRFNSPEIKRLRQNNLIVSAITYRTLEYFSSKTYNAEKFMGRKLNEFEKSNRPNPVINQSIGMSFFDTQKENNDYYNFKRTNYYPSVPSTDVNTIYSFFFVISKDINSSIGLGALDELEIENTNKKYWFSNTYKK
ncbi:hypothetical protein [Flavobacterium eburneipallidum]|uniref:hypothetical protein n=1 Tax=Flavobacterium eburneipallidum TaxID=3003263 RepID=UPI0024832639|nr:hypothetical protein [Flavobacterium eburneipallidum]